MNISNMLNNVKASIDERKKVAVNKKAQQLKGMKQERIKQEGRLKISKEYYKEKERIAKTKQELKQYSTLNQLKKTLDKRKKERASKTNTNQFGLGGRNVFE